MDLIEDVELLDVVKLLDIVKERLNDDAVKVESNDLVVYSLEFKKSALRVKSK